MQLRDYQQFEIIDPLIQFMDECAGNAVVASPTGTGKSVSICAFIKQCIEKYGNLRFMVVADVKEIIGQNEQEMLEFWPGAPVGVYSAGLGRYDTHAQIIFAGIQSIASKAHLFGMIDCVVADEAHMISPKEGTRWQKFFTDLKKVNPNVRVTGWSATPYRMGTGLLTELEIFDKMVVDLTTTDKINWFISEGYLAPLISKKPAMQIDVTNVAMKGGDFDEAELAAATDKDELNKAVALECIKQGADRNHWLVYATGKTHAMHLADRFRAAGITCEVLDGDAPDEERIRLIGDKATKREGAFQQGKFRALINIGILTKGFNFPALDMIVLVRATQSTSLYIQILGRGTRPYPGKKDCKVLDFGANILRLGPFNAPCVPSPRRKGDKVERSAPVKDCPECGLYLHTRIMLCPDCGYEFPPSSAIEENASQAKILVDSAQAAQVEIMRPNAVHFSSQPCKNESYGTGVRVSYSDMMNTVSEFHWLEAQEEWQFKKFKSFWLNAGGKNPVPTTADEVLQRARGELRLPSAVHYEANTKHKKVTKKEYEQSKI